MRHNTISSISLFVSLIFSVVIFSGCEEESMQEELNLPEVAGEVVTNAAASNGTFYILNRNSGKALDLNTSTGNVSQYSYWGGSNQKWVLTDLGNGYYRVSPTSNTGIALDIASQSTSNGANLQTYSYWGGQNQQYQFVDLGNGYYRIVNRNSGKALDVSGGSTENGANVLQWDYHGGTNQQWSLNKISGGAGQLKWTLTSSGVPQATLDRITSAMNAAVARYNAGANWPSRTLTVEYNTGVATADATYGGHIRFGANSSYQNERTALHEIAHTWGVGTSYRWTDRIVNGKFVGANTDALIKSYDGSSATISTGGGHFWPYGLNYDSEWSETNAQRHVQIVWAMYEDGIY